MCKSVISNSTFYMFCEALVEFSGGLGRKGLRRHSLFWAGGWRLEECAWWRVIMWLRGTSDPQQKLCMPLSARRSRSASQTAKPSPPLPCWSRGACFHVAPRRKTPQNNMRFSPISSWCWWRNMQSFWLRFGPRLFVVKYPQPRATAFHLTDIRPRGVVCFMSDYAVVFKWISQNFQGPLPSGIISVCSRRQLD